MILRDSLRPFIIMILVGVVGAVIVAAISCHLLLGG